MPNTKLRAVLLVSTALTAAGLASAAFAQPKAAAPNANALEEVVVTATRQTSTVNKVALSVSAVTQKNLDQQGIRNVQDLSQQVPGFTFRVSGGDNNPNLTLRGIGGNALSGTSGSAPTTGVYIDDQPLMKRNANGLLTGSGSPVPLLYDLDRVEVLRGPQGTLYGGSSEGGTLRFIMPSPSLTTYSGSARVGWSTMTGGGMGNEEGIALGGPLVQDKIGFRIAGFRQDRPGWTDRFSVWDGHQFASNVNWGQDYSLRGALLWQITPNFKATLSVFHQSTFDNDGSGVTTQSPSITVPTRTISLASGTTATNGTGVNGVAFSFPAAVIPGFTVPAQTWLGDGNGNTTGRYLTATNVQYVNSPRRTIFTTPSLNLDYNWRDTIGLKSITTYMDDRTSGDQFTQAGVRPLPTGVPSQAITKQAQLYTNQPCPSGPGLIAPIIPTGTVNGQPVCTLAPAYIQQTTVPGGVGGTPILGPPDSFGYYFYNNRRGQVTQEFRIQTIDPSWRLQFVVGGFIEHEHNHVNVGSSWNEPQLTYQTLGIPEQWLQGIGAAPVQQTPGNAFLDVSTRNIDITEDEQSVFGEATFAIIPDKLKVTAGVRAVNYTQLYIQQYGGTVASAPAGFYGTGNGFSPTVNASTGAVTSSTAQQGANPAGIVTDPNSTTAFPVNYAACPAHLKDAGTTAQQLIYAKAGCPYQYTYNKLTENPVTPKFGISYQLTPGDMLYATYAEGYRPGGINPFVPPVMCAADLANLGLTQSPGVYQRDYVKSTEVGGKFRLFNGQAQVNAAAFHIDWENVQFVESLPTCAFSYIANAAKAASDGAEVQITGRAHGFTVNGNIAYDNARYTETAFGPKVAGGAIPSILANKGDNLGVPDWTANFGIQYDTRIAEMPVYGRVDYAYTGKYLRQTTCSGFALYGKCSVAYGSATTSYVPNYINGNETHIMNARVGVYWKDLEIAGYVKNLFNSQEWINKSEGNQQFGFSGNKITPRIVGVQMNYRF